ncbi:hypothetical protein [Streptomyces sp. NPDC001165]|uniref:hypothetical protein n=1 Tax=Streptomyces sp. NPDC001165 TaxID=3364546 RepID=UPI00369B56C8
MRQEIERVPVPGCDGRLPLFPAAGRTEVSYRRADGGALTDEDFAALELLLAAHRMTGSAPARPGRPKEPQA